MIYFLSFLSVIFILILFVHVIKTKEIKDLEKPWLTKTDLNPNDYRDINWVGANCLLKEKGYIGPKGSKKFRMKTEGHLSFVDRIGGENNLEKVYTHYYLKEYPGWLPHDVYEIVQVYATKFDTNKDLVLEVTLRNKYSHEKEYSATLVFYSQSIKFPSIISTKTGRIGLRIAVVSNAT